MEKSVQELKAGFVYLILWENRGLTSVVRGRLKGRYCTFVPPPIFIDDSGAEFHAD